ncbi:hypothetical protein ACIOC2_01220 [Streptomyces sp. NPDC088337]|uniref:hypothetical protein n=1 Tax=unclassified Streptomyces TaxID=2593676 RepID=UPI00381DC34D
MTEVRVEQAELDRGVPVMYRDYGTYVRLAHDPQQIEEAAALALLCLRLPSLVGAMKVRRLQ